MNKGRSAQSFRTGRRASISEVPRGWVLLGAVAVVLVPEGFNCYRELKALNHNAGKTLLVMGSLVILGPIAGLSGYYLLSDHKAILGAIMLFASGGILYLIFQDIVPQSRLENHWAPPLGAVLGFCLALFSKTLIVAS
ncbi:ZIP family metal transporter [Shewanella salipaludis]|uniref:ZIP family metal transporter n=1 Tax=Shewanella salipaludis TaxID=2723052 RepID=UPI001B7D1CCA|nr:hypothetical protein [Shewanella salipaludis]